MAHPVIAVIGAGNMGGSLLGGLIQNGHPAARLWVTDADQLKINRLCESHTVHGTTNNLEAVGAAEVVILAVKPQILKQICEEIKPIVQSRKPLIISIAAGIREKSIQQWLGGQCAIVRAMPNTPALIGCGATALYANPLVTTDERNTAESILRAVGIVVWLDHENLMDPVTALSGSGPAYFFLVMEAMQQAAESLGLAPDTARLLTLQTALGAARMAIESGHLPAELRKNVTSPGGTTERALSVLEEHRLRDIFKKALYAASEHSEVLANSLGD